MKRRNIMRSIVVGILIVCGHLYVFAQDFASEQYQKAVWMTVRMYGGQRSGEGPNWLIMDHVVNDKDKAMLKSAKGLVEAKLQDGKCFTDDADGSHSLSGGWVDCGDHVKFGQTMFYAAYMLALAYSEFPEGYDDIYTWNYSDYKEGKDYSWEGKKGVPNGIPDILDELKYETDFLIKCAKNSTTFYSQVGLGGPDHLNWVTSVAMAALPKNQGGQADGSRAFVKNPSDCVMPSMCAATLAVMSRVYAIFDPAYASKCLTHAKYAYDYAVTQKGKTEADASGGSFYPAKSNWEDSYAIMLAEMYRATKTASYRTEALTYASKLHDHNWTLCYNNCDDLAAYLLASFGDPTAKALLKTLNDGYIKDANANKVFMRGPSWGVLRYTASQAFSAALQSKLNNETAVNPYTKATIDFIMGKNSLNLSFIVGFGSKHAKRPHHRNYYSYDDIMADQNSLVVPTKNAQFGYLVGGAKDPASYVDKTTEYQSTEGGIDYNAGLVGALGYLVSKIAPVNVNKFGHPIPELGEAQSLCGLTSVTLTAVADLSSLKAGEEIVYKWYKGNSTTPFEEGASKSSVSVTSEDTYTCKIVEKDGAWETSDKVDVTNVLPSFTLGEDITLCNPALDTLETKIVSPVAVFEWKKNGVVIAGATSSSYKVYTAGTYVCSVSATGCAAKSDTVVVKSLLPTVVNDTICAAGTVDLSVTTPGTYEWYSVPTSGVAFASGSTYSTSIVTTRTFYVQDASSVNTTLGSATVSCTSKSSEGGNRTALMITVFRDVTLASVDVMQPGSVNPSTASYQITVLSNNPTAIWDNSCSCNSDGPGTVLFTSEVTSSSVTSSEKKVTVAGNIQLTGSASGTKYWISMKQANNSDVYYYSCATSYPISDSQGGTIVKATKITHDNSINNAFGTMFNLKFSAGSTCARAPVMAVIDPNGNCGPVEQLQSVVLEAGWNVVSFNVHPLDASVQGVFGKLTNLKEVKTMEYFYNPLQPAEFNSLKTIEKGAAYLVKVGNPQTLSITGFPVGNISVPLNVGWNLVGYPKETQSPLTTVLSGVWSSFQYAKNFESFYLKDGALNTLTNMKPGSGYFIKMNSKMSLNY